MADPARHATATPRATLVAAACLVLVAAFAPRPRAEAIAAPELPAGEPQAPAAAEPLAHPASAPAQPQVADPPPPRPGRVLRLELLGTGKRGALTPFDGDGRLDPSAMDELSALLAPNAQLGRKVEAPVAIDPRLAALLLDVSRELGDAPIIVVSGHREPGRGTSRRSYHVRGMAADISVEGVKPIDLRAAALRAGARGVGLYPTFVHVDVREQPYRWGGGGRPRPPKR